MSAASGSGQAASEGGRSVPRRFSPGERKGLSAPRHSSLHVARQRQMRRCGELARRAQWSRPSVARGCWCKRAIAWWLSSKMDATQAAKLDVIWRRRTPAFHELRDPPTEERAKARERISADDAQQYWRDLVARAKQRYTAIAAECRLPGHARAHLPVGRGR